MKSNEKQISFTYEELRYLTIALYSRLRTLEGDIKLFTGDDPFDVELRQRCANELAVIERMSDKVIGSI